MKQNIVILFILNLIIAGCNKDKSIKLDEKLTDCPQNSECTYQYFEQADFGDSSVQNGSKTVFSYKRINSTLCNAKTLLYFKTDMGKNEFVITGSQIAGNTNYNIICACCSTLLLKPIDGEIKGKKISANNWLINARVILGGSDHKPIDTLIFNQHFVLSKNEYYSY
ncbi:hypothetical protein [Mucilaginibacter sp. UR6-11]|uniref:hypothetical protein n=1 Tax=Mucilaginibacter sp. UR6-11 TaxID=1435644 RepID=UPI001E55A1FA|nr:hypothetical protein [Mucilaginibacter sp. UR6-11]MCC8424590.1 hypothetical protein [Mucilaginibacter sp. UR6-11]